MEIIINQIEVVDYKVAINTENIIKAITDHKLCNDFIVFPELCLTGFPNKDNREALWQESETYFQDIILASKQTNATIIIGHIEKYESALYNVCFFIKNAEVIHIHRKSKLWADDLGVFAAGNSHSVVDVNGVLCGSQICFELEFPEGARELANNGAELVFMPNGNMQPYANVHFVLAQARAIENQFFVVLCNRVGSGHGGDFVGESLVISPAGEILCKLGGSVGTAKVKIDLSEIKTSRKNYTYTQLL
jgi:(R)-amidase